MQEKQVYNKIYCPKKWEQVNKYNKRMMEDYLLDLRAKRRSQGTIDQYKNDLRILFIYIFDELDNVPIHKLKKKQFTHYSIWLQEKNMGTRRVNRLLSALRSMLAFAEDDDDYGDDIQINYAAKVKGLANEDSREIIFLSMEEIDAMRNYFIENKMWLDATLISVLIDTGARKNEVRQIDKKTITDDGRFTNVVVGKRNKKFRLLYNNYTKETAKMLLEERGEDGISSLWVKNGKECDEDDIYYIVCGWRKVLFELTGEFKKFNVHSFRHSAAELLSVGEHYICKNLNNKKFDINEIKLLLNHDSSATTEGYLKDKSEEELLNAFGI